MRAAALCFEHATNYVSHVTMPPLIFTSSTRDPHSSVSEKTEKIVPTLFHYIETLKKYVNRKRTLNVLRCYVQ